MRRLCCKKAIRKNEIESMTTKTGANLGFEAQLWSAADKLRGTIEPFERRMYDPCCDSAGEISPNRMSSELQ